MALGGCYSCIKYLMFAFNFIFWLMGCAILGIGIWVRVDPMIKQYVDQADEFASLYIVAYVFIAFGVIIMIIGFLGCCGAIRESQWMLAVFFVLLFIIFAILLGVGIWAVIQKDVLKDEIGDILHSLVNRYDTEAQSRQIMDTIHEVFGCCGARKGKEDFEATMRVPDSCSQEYKDTPCEKKLNDLINTNFIVFAGAAIAVSFVMILGMIFSITLCCAIRDSNSM